METRGVIVDSYVGSLVSASFIPQNDDAPSVHPNQVHGNEAPNNKPRQEKLSRTKSMSSAWAMEPSDNTTDEDKIVQLTCTDNPGSNMNPMEEYNTFYEGLSILPWEDFVVNPRVLNDLFYTETNSLITYDPEEVNAFFHGKNVMPPTVGDISENGKSWNIVVDKVSDLRHVRQMLCERCSVFGLTIVYRQKRFAKPQRAPCLLLLDPSQGSLGDRLYTAFTKAMDALHRRRSFCVEINLNSCVERWCRRVLLTECKSVGAKLVVTNGEEYTNLTATEDVVCCVVCFPIWLLQTCIYKLHRKVVYDDFFVSLDEEVFLHGSFTNPEQQRQQIFKDQELDQVFRVRSVHQTDPKTLQNLGSYKFVCVKKVKTGETDDDDNRTKTMKEHNTLPFNELMHRRKARVLAKEMKTLGKEEKVNQRKDKSRANNTEQDKRVTFDEENVDIEKGSANNIQTDNQSNALLKKQLSDDGGAINVAFDDEEHQTPRIPQLGSNSFSFDDPEKETSDTTEDTDNAHTGSFFIKQNEEHRSISPIIQSNASLDNQSTVLLTNDSAVCKFELNQSEESESSESETDEEPQQQAQAVGTRKENLLHTMVAIEKTLPTVTGTTVYKAKDIETFLGRADTPTETKKSKKKKRKDKPKVGKVLKDLIKTTGASKDILPSQNDIRFAEAKAKLKSQKAKSKLKEDKEEQKVDPKNASDANNREIEQSPPKQKNDIKHIMDDSIMYFNDDINSLASTDDTVDAVDTDGNLKEDCINTEHIGTRQDKIEDLKPFDIDESSSDGEVEIIYQSSRDNKRATNVQDDEVDLVEHLDNLDDFNKVTNFSRGESAKKQYNQDHKLILSSAKHETDDDKSTKLNMETAPHRSGLFVKSNGLKTGKYDVSQSVEEKGAHPRSIDFSTEGTEIEDLEFAESVPDQRSQQLVRSSIETANPRPSSRNKKALTKRQISQRKYLGTTKTVNEKKVTKQ